MADPTPFEFEKPRLPKPQEFPARVVHTEWLGPETLRIAFEPVGAPMFTFLPGQYLNLVLPEERGLGKDMRSYSLWNHPDEFEYAVTIVRLVPGGRGSAYLRGLQAGDPVRLLAPLGSFVLRRPLHPHLYFVATGTGLVPLRSFVKDLVSRGELRDRDVTLLFGVRAQQDLFAVAELERLSQSFPRLHFLPTLSRPEPGWTGLRGRVTSWLDNAALPVDEMQVYLCGNGKMIEDAVRILEAKGLDRRTRRIVVEKYFD
jgi:CDP-4-dehydro-6-deoxyglucose reductase